MFQSVESDGRADLRAFGFGTDTDLCRDVGQGTGTVSGFLGPVRTKGVKNGRKSGWSGLSFSDAIDYGDADIEVACYRAD